MSIWKHDRNWDKQWDAALTSVPDVKEWLKGWFLAENEGIEVKFEDITSDDVHDFLSWSMFGTVVEKLTTEQSWQLTRSFEQFKRYFIWYWFYRVLLKWQPVYDCSHL